MIWLARADGSAEYLNKRWLRIHRPDAGRGHRLRLAAGAPRSRPAGPRSEKYAAASAGAGAVGARIPAAAARRRIPLVRRHRQRRGAARMAASSATSARWSTSPIVVASRNRWLRRRTSWRWWLPGRCCRRCSTQIARTLERQSPDGALFAILMLQDDGDRLVVAAAPEPACCRTGDVGGCRPVDPGIGPWPSDDASLARVRRGGAPGTACTPPTPPASPAARAICWAWWPSFYRQRRGVSDRDRDLARLGARLAGIVMERHRVDRRIGEALRVEQEARCPGRAGRSDQGRIPGHALPRTRTPLNAILGWSQLLVVGPARQAEEDMRGGLRSSSETPAPRRSHRGPARHEPDHLGEVEAGRTAVDLVAVIEAGWRRSAQPRSPRRSPSAPNSTRTPGRLRRCDRLQQIVWNLLSNAVKFTPKGGRDRGDVERATAAPSCA